jgi:S1-C subfamily serine protease
VVSSNQSNAEIYVRKECGIPVKATLITTDKILDLAIIKIDKSKIDYPIKFAK